MGDCLDKKCVECEHHILISGKVACNKGNRLGSRTSVISDFLNGEKETE